MHCAHKVTLPCARRDLNCRLLDDVGIVEFKDDVLVPFPARVEADQDVIKAVNRFWVISGLRFRVQGSGFG